jgi:plasmid maintenance system antidote protein VapI
VVTPEISIRLSEAFGQPTADIWFKIQNKYDFWRAKQAKREKVNRLKAATQKIAT